MWENGFIHKGMICLVQFYHCYSRELTKAGWINIRISNGIHNLIATRASDEGFGVRKINDDIEALRKTISSYVRLRVNTAFLGYVGK